LIKIWKGAQFYKLLASFANKIGMKRIRTKLIGTFFISIILLASISLYVNFFIGTLNKVIYDKTVIKNAIEDINFHSISIVDNLNLYLGINSVERQISLKDEYDYSAGRLKQAVEILRNSNRVDKPIFVIQGGYMNFLSDTQKMIDSSNQKFDRSSELKILAEKINSDFNKILGGTKSGSVKLRNEISQLGENENEFYFQNFSQEKADIWIKSVGNVKSELKQESFSSLIPIIDDYLSIANKIMTIKSEISDLILKEQYYLEKIRNASIDINSAASYLSNIIDNELSGVINQGDIQRQISWIIILLSFIAGGLAVFVVSKKISDSVEILALAAQKVAGGDMSQKVDIKTNDELSYLGNIFNQMTENIGKSQFELKKTERQLEEVNMNLEKRVSERTTELENLKNNLEKITEERTKELQIKLEELEKFKDLAVGRELKMVELKKEINEMKDKVASKKVSSV